VEAQLCNGGVPGACPVLLEFDCDCQNKVGCWDGVLAHHDFELHEDGSITAWKSCGIGKGKTFSKEHLGKLQSGTKHGQDSPHPQGATGADFAPGEGRARKDFEQRLSFPNDANKPSSWSESKRRNGERWSRPLHQLLVRRQRGCLCQVSKRKRKRKSHHR